MYKILDTVEGSAMTLVDFTEAMLVSGYGASMGKLDYEFGKIQRKRDKRIWTKQKNRENALRLKKYLYKLKKDKLLLEDNSKIALSTKGRKKLSILRKQLLKNIPRDQSANLIIFSYDFPEFKRKLRNRIRDILKMLDYTMIHQSLWVGKIKISTDLLKYLSELEALEHIEILEVTKEGTLKQLHK